MNRSSRISHDPIGVMVRAREDRNYLVGSALTQIAVTFLELLRPYPIRQRQ